VPLLTSRSQPSNDRSGHHRPRLAGLQSVAPSSRLVQSAGSTHVADPSTLNIDVTVAQSLGRERFCIGHPRRFVIIGTCRTFSIADFLRELYAAFQLATCSTPTRLEPSESSPSNTRAPRLALFSGVRQIQECSETLAVGRLSLGGG
jgi:hypothetical protein